jgi:steroid 5-alpha reductase family enzyme
MGEHLFTAYNYLSSSIAQAFAALIALTAMFYIYRATKIHELMDGNWKSLMKLISNYGIVSTIPTRAKQTFPDY